MRTITNQKAGLLLVLISALFSVGLYGQNNTTNAADSLVLAQNLKQISLKNKPSAFATSYTFDPKLNLYFYNVKVGTIDLFQGQEAKVVIISMTTSDVESLPRHKDFFFSRNRLNVAISRAQCVAIIIFNENLLLASTNSIEEMKLMNSFCKLLKFKTNYN